MGGHRLAWEMPGRQGRGIFLVMMLLWDGIGWNGSRRMWTARFGCVERLLLRTAGNVMDGPDELMSRTIKYL